MIQSNQGNATKLDVLNADAAVQVSKTDNFKQTEKILEKVNTLTL